MSFIEDSSLEEMSSRGSLTILAPQKNRTLKNKYLLAREIHHASTYDNYIISLFSFVATTTITLVPMSDTARIAALGLVVIARACLINKLEKNADLAVIKHFSADEIATSAHSFDSIVLMENEYNRKTSILIKTINNLFSPYTFLRHPQPSHSSRRDYLKKVYQQKLEGVERTFQIQLLGEESALINEPKFVSKTVAANLRKIIDNCTRSTFLFDAKGIEVSFKNNKMFIAFMIGQLPSLRARYELSEEQKNTFLSVWKNSEEENLDQFIVSCVESVLARPKFTIIGYKAPKTLTSAEFLAIHKETLRSIYSRGHNIEQMRIIHEGSNPNIIQEGDTYKIEIPQLEK